MGLPSWNIFKGPPPPPGPVDSMVLHGDKLEADQPPPTKAGKTAGDMDGAKELFRRSDYAAAEKVFHRIANDTKNSTQIAEEARYYEAESLRLQGHYTKAADTYSKLLKDFYSGQYREQANQRLFDIANYWLDDTRAEMEASRQKNEGKKWLVLPASYVHFEKSKPFLDEEGWAIEKMEEIVLDIRSPLADRALFYIGSVKFYRKEYREADQHFSQLVKMRPESSLAPQALKMAIICKQLTTGGSDYDGRKTAEARELVLTAARTYPELAGKEKDFLNRQLYCINEQQADKDFKIAEFYRRTGHPGSAYFYYEIVRRRYPNTPYFDKATQCMHDLKAVLEKTQNKTAPVPPPARPGPGSGPLGSEMAPTPRQLVPGSPLVYPPETAPAPRVLPADVTGNR
jgi:TolA-binding protein